MHDSHRYAAFLIGAVLCSAGAAGEPPSKYTPQPVFCADGSNRLCTVIPSTLGPDPLLKPSLGYKGLSNDVTSAAQDVQTPFDNMSWQMFVALNWQADKPKGDPRQGLTGAGKTVWQTYSRPEDVFGGPAGRCANPKKLPRFNLIAKSGGQGPRDEEFLQATGQPLIDVNGNWTLFERRLNDVEKAYITGKGLNTYNGQKAFAEGGNTVDFPIGQMTTPAGAVGAIEIKASWRIIGDQDKARYFNLQALIDVEGAYVRGGKPLCQELSLGLVGLHIIQNNGPQGNLLPQFIWASFEHQDNAPLARAACDPTDTNCYKKIANNLCPAPADTRTYSFNSPACASVTVNVPPSLPKTEKAFLWERQPPYAKSYMTRANGNACGTQVARCWQVYGLTRQLNEAWRAQLTAINSVFANYFLIGTNWGGKVEPDGEELVNGSVPAFMGNSTMETYIQADPQVGNCVNCHAGATLAYKKATSDPKKPLPIRLISASCSGCPKTCAPTSTPAPS